MIFCQKKVFWSKEKYFLSSRFHLHCLSRLTQFNLDTCFLSLFLFAILFSIDINFNSFQNVLSPFKSMPMSQIERKLDCAKFVKTQNPNQQFIHFTNFSLFIFVIQHMTSHGFIFPFLLFAQQATGTLVYFHTHYMIGNKYPLFGRMLYGPSPP